MGECASHDTARACDTQRGVHPAGVLTTNNLLGKKHLLLAAGQGSRKLGWCREEVRERWSQRKVAGKIRCAWWAVEARISAPRERPSRCAWRHAPSASLFSLATRSLNSFSFSAAALARAASAASSLARSSAEKNFSDALLSSASSSAFCAAVSARAAGVTASRETPVGAAGARQEQA